MPFSVNNNVLIPRPETEELVDWIINTINKKDNLKILDIGTGSGCIAISLAKNLPNSKVYGLDVSSEALKVSKENAKLNGVEIDFVEENILSVCNSSLDVEPTFDLIVSNPPYVRELEKAEIKANVLENEPHLALFVEDDDALLFYKAICQFAVNNLSKNGLLFFEINEYLGDEMKQLFKDFNYNNVDLKQDFFGKDRMIKASK